jgi:hypothetical protein
MKFRIAGDVPSSCFFCPPQHVEDADHPRNERGFMPCSASDRPTTSWAAAVTDAAANAEAADIMHHGADCSTQAACSQRASSSPGLLATSCDPQHALPEPRAPEQNRRREGGRAIDWAGPRAKFGSVRMTHRAAGTPTSTPPVRGTASASRAHPGPSWAISISAPISGVETRTRQMRSARETLGSANCAWDVVTPTARAGVRCGAMHRRPRIAYDAGRLIARGSFLACRLRIGDTSIHLRPCPRPCSPRPRPSAHDLPTNGLNGGPAQLRARALRRASARWCLPRPRRFL